MFSFLVPPDTVNNKKNKQYQSSLNYAAACATCFKEFLDKFCALDYVKW